MKKGGSIIKRLVKISIWSVGIIALIIILLMIFSGKILKHYIEKHDIELIGREITIDKIFINPLGTIKIENFALFENDAKTHFFKFNKLKVRLRFLPLFKNVVKIKKIELKEPYIRLLQNGVNFNLDDILEILKKDQKNEKESKWSVDLNNIKLANGVIIYRDVAIGSRFGLNNVNLTIPRIYLSGKETGGGLELNFDEGGYLHTKFGVNHDKQTYTLALNLNNIATEQFLPYFQQVMKISKYKGLLSANLDIEGSTYHILNADISGDIHYKNGELIDNKGNKLFAVDSIIANVKLFNLEKRIADFNNLHIIGPTAQYTIFKDSTTNFTSLFDIDKTAEVKTSLVDENEDPEFLKDIGLVDSLSHPAYKNEKIKFTIDFLKISGGDVTYTDHTLPKVFTYHLSEINTTIQPFALYGTNKISANAVLGKSGKVNLDWVTNFKDLKNTDLVLILNNIDITEFTPYSYHYVGNNIESGTLRLLSHNKITNSQLKGDNQLEIYKPKVSKRINKEPIYKLPVRFGLYVLTDRKKNMKVSLPISGDVSNPKFSYTKLLFKALGNLLIKVSTAPFTAIGELMSSDSENFDSIEIDSRTPDFSPKEYAQLNEIVEWMKDKTEMKFEFIQWINMSRVVTNTDSTSLSNDTLSVLNQDKMLMLAKERNENLEKYLVRMQLPKERFTIAPIVLDSLKTYKGKDKFTIVSSLEGDDEEFISIDTEF